MARTGMTCITVVLIGLTSFAEAGAEEAQSVASPFSLRLSTGVVSEYVGYLGVRLSREPAVQSELVLSYGSICSVGAWWSAGTNDRASSSDSADQVDVYATVGDEWCGIGVLGELRYQSFVPLAQSDGDVLIPRLQIQKRFALENAHTLTFSLRGEYRLTLSDFADRPTLTIGVSDVARVTDRLAFTLGVSILFDRGTRIADSGAIVQASGGMRFRLVSTLEVEAFFRAFRPVEITDARSEYTIFGAALTYRF